MRIKALIIHILLMLDLITKACFYDADMVLIPSILKLEGHKNYGMAFSMFSNNPAYITAFVAILTACLLYVFIRYSHENNMLSYGITLMLAGSIGNLIDRFVHGYVIDFICPLFVDFAVFNIADSLIAIGAAISCIYILMNLERENGKACNSKRR
ncbi:MAG: signal peptidase II [Christensenellaceae bacterium]|nr:signal peptidase II [Christensenellaceae bacterium]